MVWHRVYFPFIILFAVLMASFAWTGFTASDDSYYVFAADRWLHEFPYVSLFFGTMRETVVLPIALSMLVFGNSEFSAVLPSVLYLIGTAFLTYAGLGRVMGYHWAFAGSLVFLTIPLFILKATIPSADIALLFFVSLSFWCFWWALDEARALLLFLSGLAAAAAFLAHELALLLPLFFSLLFVAGYRLNRTQYLWLLAGFALVVGLNSLYYWVMTGDPLHRLGLMIEGTAVSEDRIEVAPFSRDDSGNIRIWGPIDPLIMFLTKQEFAFLYYLAIPAIVVMRGARRDVLWELARLLTLLAIVSGLFAGIVLVEAKLLPRYFIVTTWAAFLIALLAARVLWERGWRGLVLISAVVLVTANVLAIAVDNRNPLFGERALVSLAKSTTELIYTDPKTRRKSEQYLKWADLDPRRIKEGPAPQGKLYFYNPKNEQTSAPRQRDVVIAKAVEKQRLIARVLQRTVGESEHWVVRRIMTPNPPVVLYRAG